MRQRVFIRIGVNGGSVIPGKPPGVGRWAIRGVNLAVQHSQQRSLLPTVMSRMGNASHHDPGAAAPSVKERDLLLPPALVLSRQLLKPLGGIRRIPLHEGDPRLLVRERRRTKIYTEDAAKPKVLAETLMNHMLSDAAPPGVQRVRTKLQIFVPEHAPHTENFEALRSIGTDKKIVIHCSSPHGPSAFLARVYRYNTPIEQAEAR